jgi:hypothetical protein
MQNACLLMEALLYRMKQVAPLQVEEANIDGQRLVHRISWADARG